MITLDEARKAKDVIKSRIGRPSWLRGIGIGQDQDGNYVVKVNVASITEEVSAHLPLSVGHVAVLVEAVGQINARNG